MSRKKKLGACSGRVRVSCRVRLASMTASVTRSVMPRPSESTSEGVKRARAMEVGERQARRRAARPRQAAGERHDAGRDEPQQREGEPPPRRRRSARCGGRRRRRRRAPTSAATETREDRDDSAGAASAARARSGRGTGPRPARRAPGRAARSRRQAPSARRRAARARARAGASVGAIGIGSTLPNSAVTRNGRAAPTHEPDRDADGGDQHAPASR